MLFRSYIGNIMLLILNLPLIGIWVKVLKVPYGILCSIILGFLILGSYSVSNNAFDILVMTIFGVIGYVLRKLEFPLAPVVLTLILGPMMERSLKQSLEISQGSFLIFLKSPIAVVFLALTALVLVLPSLKSFRRGKEAMTGEEPM